MKIILKKKHIIWLMILLLTILFYFAAQSTVKTPALKDRRIIAEGNADFARKIEVFIKEKIFYFHNKELTDVALFREKNGGAQAPLYMSSQQNITANNVKSDKMKVNEQSYQVNYYNIDYIHHQPRGFVDHDENNLFLMHGDGFLAYVPLSDLTADGFTLTTIPTNMQQFRDKEDWVFDILIHDEKIYQTNSFSLSEGCYGFRVLMGDVNLEKITFKEIFSTKECDDSRDYTSPYGEGGKMVAYKDGKILLSRGNMTGDPQTDDNIGSKIIILDIENGSYEIISKGHRNVQGIAYDSEKDLLWSTEHGPQGGDELNLNMAIGGEIENYGWPVASYGWPYHLDPDGDEPNIYKQPHDAYGFIEPFMMFSPGIGICNIIKVPASFNGVSEQLFITGLTGSDASHRSGRRGVTHLILDDANNVIARDAFNLGGRIRDINYSATNNQLSAFLEYGANRHIKQTIITISPE